MNKIRIIMVVMMLFPFAQSIMDWKKTGTIESLFDPQNFMLLGAAILFMNLAEKPEYDEDGYKKRRIKNYVPLILASAGVFFGMCSAGATYMGFKDNTGFWTSLVGIPLWLCSLAFGIWAGRLLANLKIIVGSLLAIFVTFLSVVNGVIDDVSLREVAATNEENRLSWNANVLGAKEVLIRSTDRLEEINVFMAKARHKPDDCDNDNCPSDQVIEAQTILRDLGFYLGSANVRDENGKLCTTGRTRLDGIRGGCTEAALIAWSEFNSIPEEIRALNEAIAESENMAGEATIDEPSIFDAQAARIVAIMINVLAFACTVGSGVASRGQSELEIQRAEQREFRAEIESRETAMKDEMERVKLEAKEDVKKAKENADMRIKQSEDAIQLREQQIVAYHSAQQEKKRVNNVRARDALKALEKLKGLTVIR